MLGDSTVSKKTNDSSSQYSQGITQECVPMNEEAPQIQPVNQMSWGKWVLLLLCWVVVHTRICVYIHNHLLVCLVAARYRNTLEPILGRIFEEVIWFSCLSRVSKKTLLVKDESSKNSEWLMSDQSRDLPFSFTHFFFIFTVQQNASWILSILPGF